MAGISPTRQLSNSPTRQLANWSDYFLRKSSAPCRRSSTRIWGMSAQPLRTAFGLVAIGLLVMSRGPASAVADKDWPLKVQTAKSPAADASSAPQMAAEGGRAILSWI